VIYGVGIDVVEVRRIEDSMARFGRRLAEKILSTEECSEYDQSPRKARFLARRFAAKEALVKALGTGFRAGLFPGAISVTHDALGKPAFRLETSVSSALEQRGICKSHLSITDEREYALAYVLLEKN
jgi:holo-[acyl-carrier protein] synthase